MRQTTRYRTKILLVGISILIAGSCTDPVESGDPDACVDLAACLSKGTWTTKIQSFADGRLVSAGGSRGIITFDKSMTGTTTDLLLMGYADGQYYNLFAYELDAAKNTLTLSYDISLSEPTQSNVYTITSAYENKIEMETPLVNGKLIILTK